MAIRAEEFRGGDGLRPNTKLLLGTLVSQLVKAFEQAVREGEWGCAVLVGSVGQKAAGSARPRFRLGPLWGFCAVLGWDRCCWFIAAGLAVLHSCTLSAALHRGGWGGGGRQRRVVLCSVPIELRTQPHWLHRGAVLGCPLHLRPSCPREKTQPAALQIPGWLCVAVPLPVRRGGGGELPRSAPHGGWVSADPLSRPLPPLQAVAAVCGFLIVILLCLICFFAQKTRSKIWRYGKANIYWDRAPVVQEGPDVEEWVSAGGGQWERPPPTLSRLGGGDVAVTPRLCPIARSSSCHKQRCLRSAALHQELLLLLSPVAVGLSSLPTTPFFSSGP